MRVPQGYALGPILLFNGVLVATMTNPNVLSCMCIMCLKTYITYLLQSRGLISGRK